MLPYLYCANCLANKIVHSIKRQCVDREAKFPGSSLKKMCAMKRLLLLPLLLICLLPAANASHEAGGSITWECTPSGEFVFTLKIARYCSGIALPGAQTLAVHDHPTVSSIALTQVATNDLTPVCNPNGAGLDCANGDPGTVEQYVYESAPIQLSGVPPAQGWAFTYTGCCRQGNIVNLTNPFAVGTTLYGIMYPWNGTNMYPCFDSSPELDVPAQTLVCNNDPTSLHLNGTDVNRDSLVFEMTSSLLELSGTFSSTNPGPVSFVAPFSGTQPLPGWTSMDPQVGVIEFTPNMAGLFNYTTKVLAYRDGLLVSETIRDGNIQVMNCANTTGPTLNAPLTGPVYYETVTAGSTVSLTLSATDAGDTIQFRAFSSRFSDLFSGQNDCDIPFCGTLTPTPAVSGALSTTTTNFEWVTNTDHLTPNGDAYTHLFTVIFEDDECPLPNSSAVTLAITVEPQLANPNNTVVASMYTTSAACTGTAMGFVNNSTLNGIGGSIPLTYNWDYGDGNVSTGQYGGNTYTTPGSYTVTLIATDAWGTADTTTLPVTVTQGLTVTYTNPGPYCPGTTVFPANNLTVTGTATTWSWSPSADFSSTTSSNPQYLGGGGIANAGYVTATDANGCTAGDTIFVDFATASGSAGPDLIMCAGDTVQLMGSGGVTYSWDPPGELSSATAQQPMAWPAASETYTLTYTDAFGCTWTDMMDVDVHPASADWLYTANNTTVTFANLSAGNPQYYLWDLGDGNTSASMDPVHTYSAPGTYVVCLEVGFICDTLISCDTVVVTCPMPTASFSTAETGLEVACTNLSTNATSYSWSMGDGTNYTSVDPIHTYSPGIYNICLTATNSCGSDTLCDEIILFPADSVWPGDTDQDGVANNMDVLPIGLGFGSTGPTRLSTSIMWQAWPSLDWTQTFTNGDNYKFADCDGNGTIDWADTLAIVQNYGQTHMKSGGTPPAVTGAGPLLYVDNIQSNVGVSSNFSARIMLGESQLPANNVYGIAFTVHYDPALVTAGTVTYSTTGSWLGTHGQDLICLKKDFETTGTLEVGMSRNDQTNVSGFGKIAEFGGITADNLSGKNDFEQAYLSLWIDNVVLIGADGEEIETAASGDSLLIIDSATVAVPGVPDVMPELTMFPNPAADRTTIVLTNGGSTMNLRVYNLLGKQVEFVQATTSRWELSTSNYPEGVYFVAIEHPEYGVIVRKLEVAR